MPISIICLFSPYFWLKTSFQVLLQSLPATRTPFKDTVYSSTKVWPPDIFPMRCIWNLTRPQVISLTITAHLTDPAISQIVTFSGLSINKRRNESTLDLFTVLFSSTGPSKSPQWLVFIHRIKWCQQKKPHTNILAACLEMIQINYSGKKKVKDYYLKLLKK